MALGEQGHRQEKRSSGGGKTNAEPGIPVGSETPIQSPTHIGKAREVQ